LVPLDGRELQFTFSDLDIEIEIDIESVDLYNLKVLIYTEEIWY